MREKEVEKVAKIQKLAGTDLIDFSIQRTDTVDEPWMPVPYSRVDDPEWGWKEMSKRFIFIRKE